VNDHVNRRCPQANKYSKQLSKYSKSKMSSYSKKFVTSFLRDTVGAQSSPTGGLVRQMSIVKLFDTYALQEVKVHEPNLETYTAINIEPYSYTLEEQLVLYPSVIVHKWPVNQNVVIDVE